MDILSLDLQSVHYEKRELTLDAINQVTLIFLNKCKLFNVVVVFNSFMHLQCIELVY